MMKKILKFINKHSGISNLLISMAICFAKLVNIHPQILKRTQCISEIQQVEYALGFVWWFVTLKFNIKIPSYNIYHLVGTDDSPVVIELLNQKKDQYKVAKQFHLLNTSQSIDSDFKVSVENLINLEIASIKKNTSLKRKKFNTEKAFESLCYIDLLLKANGLTPFLVSGTLLGLIRDNELIAGDNDLDIGIWSEQIETSDLCLLLRKNERFISVYDLNHLVQVTDSNGTIIDIFIHYMSNTDDNQVWHGSDIHRWYNKKFDLKETVFHGHSFNVPDNHELYLEENYGNWKHPVLFWDYSFDTPNQRFVKNRKAAFFLAERIINELKKDTPCRYQVQTGITELKERFGVDLTKHLGERKSHRGSN